MKKSKQYYVAQLAVLRYSSIPDSEKLTILKTLQGDDDLAKYREGVEEEKKQKGEQA